MSQPPPSYMVDHKRGEVNELKGLLSNPKIQKDQDRKREVIKKVIAYMTLGIDVSKLFSEMVMASYTRDVVQKKLIYTYLVTYAQLKPDLALLTINTLQKDCRDEEPLVRGLALRSLCSLRVPNLAEYVMVPLRNCLQDQSPYVRKTAAIGIAKLAEANGDLVRHSDLIDVLYNMLRDKEPLVITNVISALNEILEAEGGMAINTNIIMYLLNRIREFSEWGQCAILDLVARYTPTSEDEMFDIMNLLEDRLKHANSAVVLGTTKVFLNFTANNAPLHEEVYKRLKSPLLTLMGAASHELAYGVLGHISILVTRVPHVFADSYKEFFCRYNDPSPVKRLKLQIVCDLTNGENYTDVLGELAEYVTDSDGDIGRYALRSIGKVAIKIDPATDEAIEHLLSFLDLNLDHVSTETCIVLKDILRKYSDRYEEIIPALHKTLKTVEETDGKVAVIWMIGEYGETIDDAPYILENFINGYEEEESALVRLELLTATMRLFFKRPPEVKPMLGKLLKKGVEDGSKVDVRDRALLYYRLLVKDVHEAARVVNCPTIVVDVFAEQADAETVAKIFAEFNSLSPIYGLPSERFIRKLNDEERRALEDAEAAEQAAALEAAASQSSSSSILGAADPYGAQPSPNDAHAYGAPGGGMSPQSMQPPPQQQQQLQLQPNQSIDKQQYAGRWGALPVQQSLQLQVRPGLSSPPVEQALQQQSILTFASGTVNGVIKLYLYGRDYSGVLYLCEAVVQQSSGQSTATIKVDGNGNAAGFGQLLQGALRQFQ